MKKKYLILLLVLSAYLLSGCGQMGPLYLPPKTTAVATAKTVPQVFKPVDNISQ